jgi:hypothetical protein
MAKNSKADVRGDTSEFDKIRAKLNAAPEGFNTQSDDVVGYWDSDVCPILCIPRTAKVFDGNIDAEKPSILLIVELAADCPVRLKKEEGVEEGETIVAKKGDMVGIWGKPGMRAIRDLGGVEVWMRQAGEKDTGKPNPMKLFDVKAKGKGSRIVITEDSRKESKGVRTFLDAAAMPTSLTAPDVAPGEGDPDDIPFR